jgi:hypothetical protein
MKLASEKSSGAYDIRKGAAGYAGIMGSVAGFVVPTVILAFTLPHEQTATHRVELTLATGLLVLSLLGCLASAFALAALAGEKKLTMNLPPAAMYMGVGIIFSITAILGAFEVFAHIYLPSSAGLFGAMTVGGGITGAVYNALAVIDDWEIRQSDGLEKGWFATRRDAQRWSLPITHRHRPDGRWSMSICAQLWHPPVNTRRVMVRRSRSARYISGDYPRHDPHHPSKRRTGRRSAAGRGGCLAVDDWPVRPGVADLPPELTARTRKLGNCGWRLRGDASQRRVQNGNAASARQAGQ